MPPPASPLVAREVSSLEELHADWTRLAELDGDLFKTWEWARVWEDAFGSEGRVLLTFGRAGEPLTGIARLTRAGRGPLHVLRFEGQGPGDQVGPVCDPADRAAVAAVLRKAVTTRHGRPGALLATGLMREQGWAPLLGGVVLRGRPSPVLEFNGLDWDGWLASKTKHFRQQVWRQERRLVRDEALTFRRITGPDELDGALDQFIAFHDARWQGESDFFAAGGRALHTAFARHGLARGWLRLFSADLHGQPAAYWLGYRFGDDYWFFQLARDPQWERSSIGMVLINHALRCAFEEGAVRFRFMSGGHDYKMRFANADAGHETVLVTGPVLARLARTGVTTARRLPEPVTARLRRLLSR
ncbi:Acetyltransferase involved in cellulose biosynthesis, CelD/BcsL family [Friedmanniella luteola]|uniref:Acetyltransferase involved in cellulose biosynthesis, CelD/BcsL family n=1 Tax=Friedmanniella luteola TaxID=546871 RepID=A0A1H1Q0Y2_9ACTN|nr:GNAT family N-acetyltransferase [Friedmanniella luteola]SDS16619.1 Acetyltransferase involved in cellulose biosynthesis, CelD/BcsL family [Friedmanniella luteola]